MLVSLGLDQHIEDSAFGVNISPKVDHWAPRRGAGRRRIDDAVRETGYLEQACRAFRTHPGEILAEEYLGGDGARFRDRAEPNVRWSA